MREGEHIGGYRLLRQIGEGGMGVVWAAKHGVLGRRAAIKILRPEYSMRRDTVTRFFNEACAATAISDPGIIQIFDVGHHDGSAYIVMELLDGEPLDSRLRRVGALPVASALRLCRQVASAIGAAHARGIIHRDLKPENIFVVRDQEVTGGERAKLLDFGIAKLAGDIGTSHKTNDSAIIGTPPYMSPEQCRGAGEVDRRSDIYSLGCVLFTLVVGRPPFDTKATGVLIMQHMSDPPPRPSTCMPSVPTEVDDLILRCLAKNPDDRFESGTELALAIDLLVALPSVVNAPPPVVSPAPPVVSSTSLPTAVSSIPRVATTLRPQVTYTVPPSSPAAQRRRGKLYTAVAAAVIVAGGAALTLVASQGRPRSSEAAPAPGISTPGPTAVTGSPPPTDPRPAQAKVDLRTLLVAFSSWAASHAGAPCPTIAELGGHLDPWGHLYQVTCTDQPADQVVGARSSGPDGVMGSDDDLVSWGLDDVMKLARGRRWTVAPVPALPGSTRPAVRADAKLRSHSPRKPESPRGARPSEPDGMIDIDGDGIPDSRSPAPHSGR